MRNVISAHTDAPIHRSFVDLDPEEFTRRFNAALRRMQPRRDRDRYSPPAGRAQLRAWQDQQDEVRAVLRRFDALDTSDNPARDRKEIADRLNAGLLKYVTMRVDTKLACFIPFSKDDGMLGLVWVHMARLVTGQVAEARCTQCGAYFVPARSDAEFCKPYCRLKHHRQVG